MIYINSEKASKIQLNSENFYVLSDFDRTLTRGGSISAWRILHETKLLGEEFSIMYDTIHDRTDIDKNNSDDRNSELYKERFKDYMKLLKDCNFNEDIARQSALKTNLQLREGANEFLKEMFALKVPVIIISCSIKNTIKEYLKAQNCYYDNIYIYSNEYCEELEECIYDITPYNKSKIKFSEKVNNLIKNRQYSLLFGDIVDDVKMARDKEKTITIGFLDKKIDENLEKYNKNFDIVLSNHGSFEEIKRYIKLS